MIVGLNKGRYYVVCSHDDLAAHLNARKLVPTPEKPITLYTSEVAAFADVNTTMDLSVNMETMFELDLPDMLDCRVSSINGGDADIYGVQARIESITICGLVSKPCIPIDFVGNVYVYANPTYESSADNIVDAGMPIGIRPYVYSDINRYIMHDPVEAVGIGKLEGTNKDSDSVAQNNQLYRLKVWLSLAMRIINKLPILEANTREEKALLGDILRTRGNTENLDTLRIQITDCIHFLEEHPGRYPTEEKYAKQLLQLIALNGINVNTLALEIYARLRSLMETEKWL
jgi:hypothetical protein